MYVYAMKNSGNWLAGGKGRGRPDGRGEGKNNVYEGGNLASKKREELNLFDLQSCRALVSG